MSESAGHCAHRDERLIGTLTYKCRLCGRERQQTDEEWERYINQKAREYRIDKGAV